MILKSKNTPKLCFYLREKGISQKTFREGCMFSTTTACNLINKGKGTDSTKLLASYVLGITYKKMLQLLQPVEPVQDLPLKKKVVKTKKVKSKK